MNRRSFITSLAAAAIGAPTLLKSLAALPIESDEDPSKGHHTMTLRRAAAKRGLLYGSVLWPDYLKNPLHAKLFETQVDIVTNTVYMSVTQPTRETWYLDDFKTVRNFVRKEKYHMRGHPLVWHQALPPWVNDISSKADAESVITERIKKLVGLYPGELHSWDVVNEAIDTNSKEKHHLTKCKWADLLGLEYLDLAFETASKADPMALLSYNDWGTEDDSEGSQQKRDYIYELVSGMKKRGIPVSAFGLQSHIYHGQTYKTLPDWIKKMKDLGLHIFLSELDVNDQSLPANIHERDKLVADCYTSYLTAALSVPGVEVVQNWGLSDAFSWLETMPFSKRKDGLPVRPLPFDAHFRPTDAYYAMEKVFLSK